MKPTIIALFSLLFITNNAVNGNQSILSGEKQNPDFDVIFIVKLENQEARTKDLILEPTDIKDLVVLTNEEADERLGKSNRKRVLLVVTPKPSVTFLKLDQILDHYKVKKKFRGFQLQIDNRPVLDPKAVLAAINSIYSLSIEKKTKQIIIVSKGHKRSLGHPKSPTDIYIR